MIIDLAMWYEWHRQQAPEKHTNFDLEVADMTKAGEEQLYDHLQEAWGKIFSANESTPRTWKKKTDKAEVWEQATKQR